MKILKLPRNRISDFSFQKAGMNMGDGNTSGAEVSRSGVIKSRLLRLPWIIPVDRCTRLCRCDRDEFRKRERHCGSIHNLATSVRFRDQSARLLYHCNCRCVER